ncbi:MAG: cytochrome c maturation protein CcmE [Anaerolineae bacterium]|nr:cytochrome c maturation protein CcmE [Anaerolineae bacterium]
MVDSHWEKDQLLPGQQPVRHAEGWKFLGAGLIVLAVIVYLLLSGTLLGARYYVTVDDLLSDPAMLGKKVRLSGVVVGEPVYDPAAGELRFVIAHIPNDNDTIRELGGLAAALDRAVDDPGVARLVVVADQNGIPDQLEHRAQPILSGRLSNEGGEYVFYADSISLKCPTRYREDGPDQAVE